MSTPIEPHLFVILGGTGDLARRKLLQDVYGLTREGSLDTDFRILAVARDAEMTDESYRLWAREALLESGIDAAELEQWCDQCLLYEAVPGGGDYEALATRIETIEEEA